jgi:hypothetical protein
MTHRPFDDHTLCLLNAAVWFVEQGRMQIIDWRIIPENERRNGGKMGVENKRAAVALSTPPTTLITQHPKEVPK